MKNTKTPSFVLLLCLASLAAVGAVIISPALPSIASDLNTSKSIAQWTMIVYIFGYALGQLPFGPISSHMGRKKGLYIGLAMQIFGALICAFSSYFQSINLLIFGRIILALGGASGLVLSFAIIGDIAEGVQARRLAAYLTLIFGITPGLSIALGGFITKYLHWSFCFYFLALYGIVLLRLAIRMPETLSKKDYIPLKMQIIAHHYAIKLKHAPLVIAGILMGIATSFNYVFATEAPFLVMNELNYSAAVFGVLNLIPASGLLLGSVLSGRLAHRVRAITILFCGSLGLLIVSFVMSLLFARGAFNLWTIFLPVFFIFLSFGAINANAPAYAFSKGLNRAYASATLQSINLLIAASAVLVLSYLPLKDIMMPLLFLALAVLAIIFYMFLKASVKKRLVKR